MEELIAQLLKDYGLAGLAIGFCFHYLRSIDKKVDDLAAIIHNQTFSAMMALIKKSGGPSEGDA